MPNPDGHTTMGTPPIARERLPAKLERLFEGRGVIREHVPGDVIMGPSVKDDRVRFLLSGKASIVLRDESGERISVDSLWPGDLFGEVSFFTGVPWPSDAELLADEDARVLETAGEDLEVILRSDPDLAVELVKNLVRKVMRLDRSIFESKLKRRALQSMISREEHVFPDYVMGDYVVQRVARRLDEFAQTDAPVLIVGESGVGKEGLAHLLFRKSHLLKEVFLPLDMLSAAAAPPGEADDAAGSPLPSDPTSMQERLFFGSEEPGHDGITREIPGYFELCEGGTLLVRGVDKLTPLMQLKLLEAVVTQTYRRHGGLRLQKGRVRLIATTRVNPEDTSPDRHPLLHALKDRCIVIPPLRTRRREIPGLVRKYLSRYREELHQDVEGLPEESLKALVNYTWPGNDLELSTTLKRALLVSKGARLRPQDIYFDLKRTEGKGRFNLFRIKGIRQAITSPLYPAVLQSAAAPFFLIIVLVLFLGSTDPLRNPAALFSWAIGWPMLIIGAFLWGRFWCTVCPIGVLANLAKRVIAAERPFPRYLKQHSDFLLAGAVLLVIWFETATNIRESPFTLGLLLSAMLVSAIVIAMVYERESWCLYLCGLGGMAGVLAKASILELRADRNVCISQCSSNECYVGTAGRPGCPFGQAGPRLHSNRMCKLCGGCVKNCPHGAINLNLRAPGREIWEIRHTNPGTAFLVLGMIGGLVSEMATRAPFYEGFLARLHAWPETVRFTALFVIIVAGVNLLVIASAVLSRRVLQDTLQENYSRFGLALLPLTLATFLAYHLYYLIHLGVQLPILISRELDLSVFQHLVIQAPAGITLAVQLGVVGAGILWTLLMIALVGREARMSTRATVAGIAPHWLSAMILGLLVIKTMRGYFG